MIPLREQEMLRRRFESPEGGLAASVRLDHFTQPSSALLAPGRDPCPGCDDARTLVRELASLSDRMKLEEHQISDTAVARRMGVERVPATVVRGPNNRPLRFYGLPTGSQFPVLMETLVAASRGGFDADHNGMALSPTTKQRLKRLREDVRLTVFVGLTDSYSTQMALLAFALGIESHRIRPEVVEIAEFPRLAQRYEISGVPTLLVNDSLIVRGATPESQTLDLLFRVVQSHGAATGELTTDYVTPIPPPPTAGGGGGQAQERRSAGGLILPPR